MQRIHSAGIHAGEYSRRPFEINDIDLPFTVLRGHPMTGAALCVEDGLLRCDPGAGHSQPPLFADEAEMTDGLLCIGDNVVDMYLDRGIFFAEGNALSVLWASAISLAYILPLVGQTRSWLFLKAGDLRRVVVTSNDTEICPAFVAARPTADRPGHVDALHPGGFLPALRNDDHQLVGLPFRVHESA